MNAARQSCERGLLEDDPLWPALMSAAEAGDLPRCKRDHSGETPREYAKRIGFHMR